MGNYRRLLSQPDIGILIAATTLTRVPFAINTLAVLLFVREATGSFATAGLVTGAAALGAAFGAPVVSRLVDRRGARVLTPVACGHALALLVLVVLGDAGAPAGLLAGVAAVAGLCFPPSGSVLRARFSELLGADPELIRSAYALDSVTIEVSFVSGPLITAAAIALAGPEVALFMSAALVVLGTVLFYARLPGRVREPHPDLVPRRGVLGILGDPGIRTIVLATIPIGFCLGCVEVAVPAFAAQEGRAELAGVLLALWSLGSGVGGLVFGARTGDRSLIGAYLWLALLFPLASLPMVLASAPAAMGILVLIAGAPLAPMIASRNELVGLVAPGGSGTEAFTWLMTALIVGVSAGNAIGGALSDSSGWESAVLAGAAVALAGGMVAFARRGSLRPRAVGGGMIAA
jgi:predicted MFS family arabinose efflux permease